MLVGWCDSALSCRNWALVMAKGQLSGSIPCALIFLPRPVHPLWDIFLLEFAEG